MSQEIEDKLTEAKKRLKKIQDLLSEYDDYEPTNDRPRRTVWIPTDSLTTLTEEQVSDLVK